MVRIIVGTLVQVGLGVYSTDDVKRMLDAKDRKTSGSTAPPHGLYLQWIKSARPANANENSTTESTEVTERE
jgi:tRNA U38,U39,U40 pseudouridine synthase TruA